MSSHHLIITDIRWCNHACPSVTYKLVYTHKLNFSVYLSDINFCAAFGHVLLRVCMMKWTHDLVVYAYVWSCDVLGMMGKRRGVGE